MLGRLLVVDLPPRAEIPKGIDDLLELMEQTGCLKVFQAFPGSSQAMVQMCRDEWTVERAFSDEGCVAFCDAHMLFHDDDAAQQAVAKVFGRCLERGISVLLLGENLRAVGAGGFARLEANGAVQADWYTEADFVMHGERETQ